MPYVGGLKEEAVMTEEQIERVLDYAQVMMKTVLDSIEDPDLCEVATDVAITELEGLGQYLRILFDPEVTGGASEPQT